MSRPRFTVVSDTGRMYALRADYSGQAAGLCAKHWYPSRDYAIITAPDAVNTDTSGVYDVIDQITREYLDQLTVTPYAAAHARQRAPAADLVRKVCVTLDDGSADTLRTLGDGNLSLGIRRAAALTGTGAGSGAGFRAWSDGSLTRMVTITLDDGSADTLRALGDGNLSLGIRRAAALIGGQII